MTSNIREALWREWVLLASSWGILDIARRVMGCCLTGRPHVTRGGTRGIAEGVAAAGEGARARCWRRRWFLHVLVVGPDG